MIRRFIALVLTALALNAFAGVEANQASRADLETVKGIGPGLSAKILDARKTGQFKDWNDLVDRVGGIGPGNATRFSQAGLTVAGAPYDGSGTVATASAAKPAKEAKAKTPRKAEGTSDGKAAASM